MISKWNNLAKDYNNISPASTQSFPTLPTGAYACEIKGVTLKTSNSGKEYIEMMLDIIEGEYKDFFIKDYRSQKDNGNKFWRGCFNLWVPDDNAKEWQKNAFLRSLKAIDVSNPGYTFDGNEQGLKGKCVCALFRKEEYIKDGTVKSAVKPFMLVSMDDYRNGKIGDVQDKLLDDKDKNKQNTSAPVQNNNAAPVPTDFEEVISDGDLPF